MRFIALALGVLTMAASGAMAATITMANTGNDLVGGTIWVGGTAPGSGDTAVFSNNWTTSLSVATKDISWQGLRVFTPGGNVTASGSGNKTLTLGSGGIDMSVAGVNLTFGTKLSIALSAAQSWNVASGRLLTVTEGIDNNGNLLTVSGLGGVTLNGAISDTGGLALTGDGVLILSNTNNAYGGDTVISSGTLRLGAAGVLPEGSGKGDVSLNATLNLAGFSEKINGLSGNGAITNSTGSSTLTVGNDNDTSTFSGMIRSGSGTIALTKVGTGVLTLSGNNTYTGGTTVSNGTLRVNNTTGSGTGTGAITIESGGTLGGTGAVTGAVTVNAGGIFGLGNSVGTFAAASLTLQPSSTMEVEMASLSSYDKLTLTGSATLGGDLDVVLLGGYTPNIGDSFTIITAAGGVTGAFDNVPTGYEVSIDGNNVVLNVIPEPSALTLAAGGMLLLALVFRRRASR